MAIQDETPKKKLWTSLNQGGFYSKSYEDFDKQFSSPEKISSLYKSLHDAEYYTNDEAQFTSQFFSEGKQPEVSPIGSETTSPISAEPTQNTVLPENVPDQLQQAQNGELLGQSSLENEGGALLPPGAIVDPSGRSAYFDPSRPYETSVVNVIPDVTVVGKKQDKGVWSDLYNSLASGSASLGAGIASVPELIYNIAAIPQNLAADITGNDAFRANYEDISAGVVNPLGALVKADKAYQELSEEHRNQVTKFEDDIVGSLSKGNLLNAGRQVGNAFVESIPAMIGMAATSGAGQAANIGAIGRNVITSLPFAGSKFQEIEDDKNIPSSLKPVIALANGLSEVVFEEGFGTQALIRGIIDKSIAKEGVEQFTKGYMQKLLASKGIPASAFKGSIDEMSTQLSQNIIDKYSGVDPNRDLWQGVADAGIVGFVSDGVISGGAKAVNSTKLKKIQDQNTALVRDLDQADPETAEGIQAALDENIKQYDEIESEVRREYNSLPDSAKKELTDISKKKAVLERSLNDPNISDESKEAIQSQIDQVNKQRDEVYTRTEDPETETIKTTSEPSANMTPERIDESVIAQRKVAPELENAPIGSIEVPDSTFDTIAKIEAKEAIEADEITKAVDSLYDKKKELKSLINNPDRVNTTSEINEAISGIDADLEALTNYEAPIVNVPEVVDRGIANTDFAVVKPGDQFAEGEVKSAAINQDGSVDVTMTDGTILNSKDYVTEKEVQPVSSEEAPVTPVENVEVAPVGEASVPAQEVVDAIDKMTDEDIISELDNIEEKGVSSNRDRYNKLEKELEQKEWNSIQNVDINTAKNNLEKLKAKKINVFAENSDINESIAVINKYENPSDISDNELKTDFTNAIMGNPESWNADNLKLKLAVQESINRGFNENTLIDSVVSLFTKDGFSEDQARKVIADKISKVRNKNVNNNEGVKENTPVTEENGQSDQEVATEPQQVVEPEITVVQPKLKNIIKNIPNQDINSLMGPANVEARRDVIEAITGKRPSKNDAGINNVKSTLNKALGLSGNEANKATQLRDWANYERTEFSNPDEYVRYTAENTTNPDEILSLYENEPDSDPNDKNIKIAKWLGDGGKVNLKDYREFGDINNLTKDIASRRIDSGDNKRGLTGELEYAFDESDGITPADVIEFITDYKNESDYISKNKSANKVLLEDRFRELTGRNITPKVLETYGKRKASAVTDAELVSRDPNMQELGITPEEIASRQQMETEADKVASKESDSTAKSLLKGISDRLKETGIAKSVKLKTTDQVNDLGYSGENVNGYVDADGNIVINSDRANIDTPIHEFAHIWERTMEKTNPELHAKGMELIQTEEAKPYIEFVNRTQPGLQGDGVYKEALAQAIGDSGSRLIKTQERSVIKEWLKAAWDYIGTLTGLSGMNINQIQNLTLREYTEGAAIDLLQGKTINKTPSNNMVMAIDVSTEKELSPAEKFNADFIRRRQQAQSIYFSGDIGDLLSDQDFQDYIQFTKNAIELGQIPGKAEHDTLAAQLGITNAGQIDMAYNFATLKPKSATGVKVSEVSARALSDANFNTMSDEEFRDKGRELVESGVLNPERLVGDIVSKPRPLDAREVAGLQYYQTTLNNEYITVSELLESNNNTEIDAYSYNGEKGYKAISMKADVLRQASYDLDLAIIASGKEQSAAFRLRSILSDKDFNIVSFMADMKARGYLSPEQEAKFNAMSNELNDIKAKLKSFEMKAERSQSTIDQNNIQEAANRKVKNKETTRSRNNRKETVKAFEDVLDGLNPDDFGMVGMNFQKGLVQFSLQPNTKLGLAVSEATEKMKANVQAGLMNVSEAVENAISEIDGAVGKGNWDSMKFRSTIMNRMTNKQQVIKSKKPYVNTNGVLVVPGSYLTDLVKQGYDTIDAMVDQTKAEVGDGYSDYDIRNAISGYGKQASPTLNDIQRKIGVARSIAKLTSELEDLITKGKSAKTAKVKHQIDTRVQNLREEIKQREYDLAMTPDERAQLAEQRYNQTRERYLENYISQLEDRIVNEDFAPRTHVNRYADSQEVIDLRAKAEKLKNEFKKAKYQHELENMSPEQKAAKLVYEVIFNSTRALSAGSDLSAIGVQGAIFSFARPKDAARLLWSSRKQTFSEVEYENYFATMQTDPYFELARKSGLNLQLPNFYQSVQEEQFKGDVANIIQEYAVRPVFRLVGGAFGASKEVSNRVADNISPLTAADRNYSVVLSRIRFDLFKEFLTNQQVKNGLNNNLDADKIKDLAETVNTITMASTVPFVKGNKAANNITSALFFSLRKMIATWKILGMWGPMLYKSFKGDAGTRAFNKQLLFDAYGGIILNGMGKMFAMGAIPFIAGAMYGIGGDDDKPEDDDTAKAAARKVYNPNFFNAKHSDFMKIKIGDTRISLFQGIDGNVIFATRIASGEYMTSSSNAIKQLDGVGGNKDRRTVGIDYMANKLAPTASLIWKYTGPEREQNEVGERFTQSILPMWMTSGYEQYASTDNPYEAVALGSLGIIGLSYNNYGGAEFANKKGTNNKKVQAIFKESGLSAFNPTEGTKSYFTGQKVSKARGDYFKKQYLPAYEQFMTEAVLSNEAELSLKINWSIKEGLVNNLKKESYKYAQIATTGVNIDANFKNFTVDGEAFTLLPSQYKLKKKYIDQYMKENDTESNINEIAKDIREEDPKMTLNRAKMLAKLKVYNEANTDAKYKLYEDYESGKVKLIKKQDFTKDMEREDDDSIDGSDD